MAGRKNHRICQGKNDNNEINKNTDKKAEQRKLKILHIKES